jgi:hypothetical protein
MISIQDFQIAGSAATFLLEDVDETAGYPLAELRRFRCYETTMVIAYARPFSMARGAVMPLKKTEVLKRKDEFNALHEKLIAHRNTLYGHSDAEFVEMRVWSIAPFEEERPDIIMTLPRFDEGMRFTYAEVERIHEKLRLFVHTLTLETQRLGITFKDRFRSA